MMVSPREPARLPKERAVNYGFGKRQSPGCNARRKNLDPAPSRSHTLPLPPANASVDELRRPFEKPFAQLLGCPLLTEIACDTDSARSHAEVAWLSVPGFSPQVDRPAA